MVDENNKLSNSYHLKNNLLNRIKGNKLPDFLSYTGVMNLDLNGITSSFINDELKKLGRPEIAVLGLGADGHTASLFPGNPGLHVNDDKTYIIVKNNYENFFRISLTFNYLMKSKHIVFLISGETKSKVLRDCLNEPYEPAERPAQYLFKNYNNKINIFCDKAAADGLFETE